MPGDRVIFAEDFSHDNVGDFPKRLELRRGNFEVAKWQGQQFLRTNSGGVVIDSAAGSPAAALHVRGGLPRLERLELEVNFDDPDAGRQPRDGVVLAGQRAARGRRRELLGGPPRGAPSSRSTHVAVMADGKYVKTYVNGVRVANVPNANIGRGKVDRGGRSRERRRAGYLSNIRVAAGGKPLYDAIMADGRVATHGILFDTGSDRIRGESKPTLDLIGQMLKDHADLKLTIEGHTDNVGAATSNQTLSDKRAAAVRQFLIANYHVDAGRLASKGLGATKPAASNDTPEGRQQNRRVELVKN